jgi:hypothetical protein
VVGALSDLLTPRFGDEALRYALAGVAVLNLVPALLYLMASRTLNEDIARASTGSAAHGTPTGSIA